MNAGAMHDCGDDDTISYARPAQDVAAGDPTAVVPFRLRSERSGKREGRARDITADATFDNGLKECSWTTQVVVPHDMRGGADW